MAFDVVPGDVEGSSAAGDGAGVVSVELPLVSVEPAVVSVEPAVVSVEPAVVSVEPALASVPPAGSVEAVDELDPEPPLVASPVLVGSDVLGVLEEESPAEEVEAAGLDGVVAALPLPSVVGDGVPPDPVGLADGSADGCGPEVDVGLGASGVEAMPAGVLAAVPGGASGLVAADVEDAEPEVDPLEPAGVLDGAEAGLPSGVAVTVVGAPGARTAGAPEDADDPTAEAS